jgi:hypothetical protein
MTRKDALAWGNSELAKLKLDGMMRFRAGRHSSGQTCVDLITMEGDPYHVEGLLLDYCFAESYRAAVGRLLLRVRMAHRY